MTKLSHIGDDGRPHMVDVGGKPVTARRAVASGSVRMQAETLPFLREGTKKGDVIGIAVTAGIMAAKKTSEIIPLCHPLPLTSVDVSVEIDEDLPGVRVSATAKTDGKTGVEMEALTAVTGACLTLYDMLKAVDKTMVICEVRLVEKTGGKSDFRAD